LKIFIDDFIFIHYLPFSKTKARAFEEIGGEVVQSVAFVLPISQLIQHGG
jgi:hypothetical protein